MSTHISFTLILKSSYQFSSFKLLQFVFPPSRFEKTGKKDEIEKYQKPSSKHVLRRGLIGANKPWPANKIILIIITSGSPKSYDTSSRL